VQPTLQKMEQYCSYMKRIININTIANFQTQLFQKPRELVFDENDINKSFNLFFNTFLRIYSSSFPLIQATCMHKQNSWITPDIRICCKYKRKVYKELRKSNNPILRTYHRNYSKILTTVIKSKKNGIW
jgi:hypothetical protein